MNVKFSCSFNSPSSLIVYNILWHLIAGLIGVLQGRRMALESLDKSLTEDHRLYLLAPKQIMSWLWLYDRRFERIVQEIDLIPNASLVSFKSCIFSKLIIRIVFY